MILRRRQSQLARCLLNAIFIAVVAGEPVCLCLSAAQSAGTAKADAATQANAIYVRGMSALQSGDLQAAGEAFEQVLRLVPNSADAHNSLGWVLLAQSRMDAAIAQFRT